MSLLLSELRKSLSDLLSELLLLLEEGNELRSELSSSLSLLSQDLPHIVVVVEHSAWGGLVDLCLSDRGVGDASVACLLRAIGRIGGMHRLRRLDLRGNKIKLFTLKALLFASFPLEQDPEGEGDYWLDEETRVDEVRDNNNLTSLDLSNNCIDDFGCKMLCIFLKLTTTLLKLDVSGNDLGDYLSADIIHCLAKPFKEFDRNDSDLTDVRKQLLHNFSITDLSIGRNGLADISAETLRTTLRNNAVLRRLHMDVSNQIDPSDFKRMLYGIKLYNCTLEDLSFADTCLSVKTADCIFKLGLNPSHRLTRLSLPRCGLKSLHIRNLPQFFSQSKTLSHLDLSGNKQLGDKGAELVGKLIEKCSLLSLDLSDCGFSSAGCVVVVASLSVRGICLKWLDLSHNRLGQSCDEFVKELQSRRWEVTEELFLNGCGLGSRGADLLFSSLSLLSSEGNGKKNRLRCLQMSNNHISDTAAPSLCRLLSTNTSLRRLDLGFNDISERSEESLRLSISVRSDAKEEKKLAELAVNLIGNGCDPYVLDTPGMTRSKNSMIFGIKPNPLDPHNSGYSHISYNARGNYMVRKELHDIYDSQFELKQQINSIS